MKNTYVSLILFILLVLSQKNLYSFEKDSTLDKKLIGVYKSENTQKIFFLREQSARSKNINGVDFLEINFPDKSRIFKYKFDNKKLILNDVEPKDKYKDSNMIFQFCKSRAFKNKYVCKKFQYKYVELQKEEGEKKYRIALHDYLTKYTTTFDNNKDIWNIQNISKDLPIETLNTKLTSATLVYKTSKPLEVDYESQKESLWFLSLGDNPVNIYINGLDFRNGTPDAASRHARHKKDWSKYYKSYALKDDFNIVYSWDSAYGIIDQNTKQLVMLIEFILKNNTKNKINLIGHSQGGNFAKDVMVKLYDRNIDMKNIRLISLATPHKGIKEMDPKSIILLPTAEIMYDIFSLNLNTRDQVIQASKRLYNGVYKQLYGCKRNKYLQKLNKNFISRGLYKNAVLIAGKNDKIICEKSSLFEGVVTIKKRVNNSHGNIVVSPDNEIFKIIADLK